MRHPSANRAPGTRTGRTGAGVGWPPSIRGDAVESRRRRQTPARAEIHERAVTLDREGADRATRRIQRIEEMTVGAHRDVEVRRTRGVLADDRAADRRE